jgi:Domain of unknown function (DUF4191)
MAKPSQEKVGFVERLKQIGMVFRFTAKQDKWFVPLVVGAVLIPLLLTVIAGILLSWVWIPLGIMITLLAVLLVLNLRSNTAMLNAIEGQPGAPTQIMTSLRGNWRVKEQPVAFTVNNDFVHLVLGPPGVVLVAEGDPNRVRGLLGEQKRRMGKVIGQTPLYDIVVGNDEGQVPLRKLRTHLMKLPRNMSGKEINSLDRALTALTAKPQMPKGGLPKEFRPPRSMMRQQRGR